MPGAKESDYRVDEELNRLIVEESEIAEEEAELERKQRAQKAESPEGGASAAAAADEASSGVGSISFISCGNKEASQAMDKSEEQAEQGTVCGCAHYSIETTLGQRIIFVF